MRAGKRSSHRLPIAVAMLFMPSLVSPLVTVTRAEGEATPTAGEPMIVEDTTPDTSTLPPPEPPGDTSTIEHTGTNAIDDEASGSSSGASLTTQAEDGGEPDPADEAAAGTLTVTVLSSATNEAIAGASVSIRDEIGMLEAEGVTGSDGTFTTLDALPSGNHELHIAAVGYVSTTEWAWVDGPITHTMLLHPKLDGVLSLTVTDPEMTPIPGASVLIRDSAGAEVASGPSDGEGTFATGILSGGWYDVSVTADGYLDGYTRAFIEGDTSAAVTLEPRREGTLTIVVIDLSSGDAVPAATVIVRTTENVEMASGATDAAGRFVSETALPSAWYNVEVQATGYSPSTMGVHVNGPTETSIGLEPRIAGTLTVTVVDDTTDAPIPGAAVIVRDRDGNEAASGATDGSGAFAVDLPGGDYTVEATAEGFYRSSISTRVSGDTPVSLGLQPRVPGMVTATVTVTATETATATPSETATSTATQTATATSEPRGESESQPMELSFTLCGNENCTPPHNTGADGYTASWTVTEQPQAKRAGIMAFQQPQGASTIVTAVLQGGVATGFSEPLPLGGYEVCLSPLLTGPDGSTIRIAGRETCEVVELTEADQTGEPATASFAAVIVGDPQVTPAPGSPTQDAGEPTSAPTGTQPTPATGDATTGGVDRADRQASPSGSREPVTGLPSTGAGEEGHPAVPWLLLGGALALAGAAIGLRRRQAV